MLALATVLLVLLAPLPAAAGEGDSVVHVTTETREYCSVLADRFAAMRETASPLARALAEDGIRLCANGHVRTGVARLRRAIRLARE
ncbi:MAG: hypothetical protein IRZ13_20275 [Acetobacteraceae bacterium]|nr:hypothetical protein [Acetobacteraceae bacterium]